MNEMDVCKTEENVTLYNHKFSKQIKAPPKTDYQLVECQTEIKRPNLKQIKINKQCHSTPLILNSTNDQKETNAIPNLSSPSKLYSTDSTKLLNKKSNQRIYHKKLQKEEKDYEDYDYEDYYSYDQLSYSNKVENDLQPINNSIHQKPLNTQITKRYQKTQSLHSKMNSLDQNNYSTNKETSQIINKSNFTDISEQKNKNENNINKIYHETFINSDQNDNNEDRKNNDYNIKTIDDTDTNINNIESNNIEYENKTIKNSGNFNNQNLIISNCKKNFHEKLVKYQMYRSNTVSIYGKNIHYQLCKNGNPVLHSKVKSIGSNGICYVREGIDLHFSQNQFVGAILYSNKCSIFSIREENEFGKEIMKIMYRPGINKHSPRLIDIDFPLPYKNIPQKLQNRRAILNEEDQWEFDMKVNFTIKSIKNCIITDEMHKKYASVMKVDRKTLNIEANPDFSDLMVFALGLSSFFCKL